VAPDVVLCSSAVRTRQTLDAILPSLGGDPVVEIEDELYGAWSDALLERIRAVPAAAGSALLIGHNPGISDLALVLAGADTARLRDGFPTGALATLAIAAEWAALDAGGAELTAFVVPREL
jgi:phosphohistidine phosphatase